MVRAFRTEATGPSLGSAVSESSSLLSRISALANRVGLPTIAAETGRAETRLAEGRFYVALVGQLKRGKSSLLNALLGRALLPTGVVPITSVVTVVRYAAGPSARVLSGTGEWLSVPLESLEELISELHNPGNERGVLLVEVFDPSPLLAEGMCLVDTPGIGSVIAANSAATRAFVPHIDAALVVLGVDPPISGEELALVAEVAREVPDLLFVLSKTDRFSERERREASAFTRQVLARRLGGAEPEILEVSAREPSGADLGCRALAGRLSELARNGAGRLVREAERREAARLARRVASEVAERQGALLRPLAEADRRRAELADSIAAAERSLGDLGALFRSEADRLARALVEHRTAFLAHAIPAATEELARGLRSEGVGVSYSSAVESARRIARARIEDWASREDPQTERSYRETMQRFRDLANEFLAQFLRAGEPGVSGLSDAMSAARGFRCRSRRHYTELLESTSPSLADVLLDRLLPRGAARRRGLRGASRLLERLLSTNSARVQNDLLERIEQSRGQLESEVRWRLTEVLRSASAALERATGLRAAGAEAVLAEVRKLAKAAGEATALLAEAAA